MGSRGPRARSVSRRSPSAWACDLGHPGQHRAVHVGQRRAVARLLGPAGAEGEGFLPVAGPLVGPPTARLGLVLQGRRGPALRPAASRWISRRGSSAGAAVSTSAASWGLPALDEGVAQVAGRFHVAGFSARPQEQFGGAGRVFSLQRVQAFGIERFRTRPVAWRRLAQFPRCGPPRQNTVAVSSRRRRRGSGAGTDGPSCRRRRLRPAGRAARGTPAEPGSTAGWRAAATGGATAGAAAGASATRARRRR